MPQVLRFPKDFIIFAEKEKELQKFILRQHQSASVDNVVARALDPQRTRGLVWHTQGSGNPGAKSSGIILLRFDRRLRARRLLARFAAMSPAQEHGLVVLDGEVPVVRMRPLLKA